MAMTSSDCRPAEPPFWSRRTACDRPPVAEDEAVVLRAVAAAQSGDRDAVRYLYARFADAVHRRVAAILQDEHEAEDVTQQVFVKLYAVIGQYQQRSTPFRAWLFCVARNAALDNLRARRCVSTCAVAPARRELADRSGMSVLRDALLTLPADQRDVVFLRHVVGLSPSEIAARLGKSESAVHGLHHRGRKAMRRALEALQAAPATRPAAERA